MARDVILRADLQSAVCPDVSAGTNSGKCVADHRSDEVQARELFSPGEDGQLWYAFHSRPRCEKKAADVCAELRVRHYLPLRESVSRRSKDRDSFMVPLFPGYLFGCCDQDERLGLMRRNYLVRWIEVVDQHRLLDELTSIYLACQRGAGLMLYPQMKRGREVRVTQGPLTGVKGMISKRKKNFKLVLNMSALGTAVSIGVDMQDVELIER